MRVANMRMIVSTFVLPLVIGGALIAQRSGPPAAYPAGPAAAPSVYKSWADIDAELAKLNPASLTGAAISVSRAAGNVGVRRRSAASKQYALIHPHSFEVYQIIDGSATYVT